MIRNIIILDNDGQNIMTAYFGECHSLGNDLSIMSGFIAALHRIGQSLTGKGASEIRFAEFYFVLLAERDFIFAVSADDDDVEKTKIALTRIADLFLEEYGSILWNLQPNDNFSIFQGFPDMLIKLGLTQKNCGKYVDCQDCSESSRTLPMEQVMQQDKKR